MSARVGVVVFPGTNCDHDVASAVDRVASSLGLALRAEEIWHGDRSLAGVDAVVLPGGFAHGDYLRPGAIARFSPVMDPLARFAAEGGPVVGICNGFQVLTEAGMLPGALQKNSGLRFLCKDVDVRVCNTDSVATRGLDVGERLRLPVNHFEGNYTCDKATLDRLVAEERVVLRYEDNPNGSLYDIAGVRNEQGNVVGLMPHPERACDALTGSVDGARLLGALLLGVEAPSPSFALR